MTKIEIVPATKELLDQFYGHTVIRTVKALVAVKDGIPVGVSGVFLDQGRYVLFSENTPELLSDKRAIIRLIRATMQTVKSSSIPVYSASEESISKDGLILRHMGFTETEKGVFVWHS